MSIDYIQSRFVFDYAGPGIEVTPDGEYVFTTSPRVWDEEFKLWYISTGRCVRTYKGYASVIKVLPDNERFLVGNKSYEIEMRQRDGTCIGIYKGHKRAVRQIEIASAECVNDLRHEF